MSAALALLLAAFVGGQEPKKDAQPPKEAPKEAPKEQPKEAPKDPPKVDGKRFEPKFEKDKKFYQKSTTRLEQIVQVQGQNLSQRQESTFLFEWTPLRQEGDKWVVRQRVEGLRMTIDISGNQISYDSTKGDSPTAGNPGLTEFFRKLNGAEFTATLDKNYKVEKVDGRKQFVDGLGAGNPQMDALLNKILTEDALKDMCDPTLKLVPQDGSGKKVGDTWERKSTLSLGPIGSYEVTYKFKYAGVEKDLDKIEVETTLTYTAPKKDDPAAGGLLFRISEGKLTTDGPGKGVILYNPKTGLVESAKVSIKLKGELTVQIGGTDTKVGLEQDQTTEVESKDTSFLPKKG
ncbi:MAG: hypothetical protein C0501_22895 [Isosphaera sp.]|nr:hypothetical protein [Isosphaera sp.]